MNKKTKILKADNQEDLLEAVRILQSGEIVAVPTETVYGLAADAQNVQALNKIFKAKNRPTNHPLIVHVASFEELSKWAKDIPPIASVIAKNFWPGPITLLLKKHDEVNDVVTGGLTTIAIRIPQNKAFLKILNLLNTGLAAPSANPYKRISPTTAQHVMSGLSGKIDAIVDDGPCTIGLESTILDLTTDTIRILRHGPITKKMIESVLKISIESPDIHVEKVSGNMKSHYQPYTKTSLMDLAEIETYVTQTIHKEKLFGVIHYSNLDASYHNVKSMQLSSNKTEYSKLIYSALHEIDGMNVDEILVELPPSKDSWKDIHDRLSKATATDH